MKILNKVMASALALGMLASLSVPTQAAAPNATLVKFDTFAGNQSVNDSWWTKNNSSTSTRWSLSDDYLTMINSGSTSGNCGSVIYFTNGFPSWTTGDSGSWNALTWILTAKMTLPECSASNIRGDLDLCGSNASISTKLVYLLSNGDGTFDVEVNTSGKGATDPNITAMSNVEAGTWVDVVVAFTGSSARNNVTYYVNGTKAADTVTFSSNRPQVATGILFQAYNTNTDVTAKACFDDISLLGYSSTPKITDAPAVVRTDSGIKVTFANRLTGVASKLNEGKVTVNGAEKDYTVSDDRMSITIEDNSPNEAKEVVLTGFTDIMTNTLSSYSTNLAAPTVAATAVTPSEAYTYGNTEVNNIGFKAQVDDLSDYTKLVIAGYGDSSLDYPLTELFGAESIIGPVLLGIQINHVPISVDLTMTIE